MALLVALLAVLIGLLALLFGYRLFLVLLPLWGFFAGLWLGVTGFQTIFGQNFLAGASGLVFGFFLGLILALLSYLFYYIGVLVLGGTVGYGLTYSILVNVIGISGSFIVFLISLIVGILFVLLFITTNAQKYLIVLITSLGGASAVISGGLLLFNQISTEDISGQIGILSPIPLAEGPVWWIVWLVLAVMGIIFQSSSTLKYKMEKPPASRF